MKFSVHTFSWWSHDGIIVTICMINNEVHGRKEQNNELASVLPKKCIIFHCTPNTFSNKT